MDPVTYTKVKIRLIERGLTWQSIADELGVTRQTVWCTAKGTTKSERVRAAIAKAVGMSVKRLWPEEKAA